MAHRPRNIYHLALHGVPRPLSKRDANPGSNTYRLCDRKLEVSHLSVEILVTSTSWLVRKMASDPECKGST